MKNRTVYLVIEDEPDADEFPSICVAVATTKKEARAAIRRQRAEIRADGRGHKLREGDITHEIEPARLVGPIDTSAEARRMRRTLDQIRRVLKDERGQWRELDSCADAVQDISLILAGAE